ncbi:pyridine nucleotide-disulfide oxidoreductase/dicluster-binding protein [Petroclostridium sp. X23]|uniref:pyridine nucleotide-disulfide oxidoreductase/dicluster-binding protein n=1 Tax=Petroclostridium sp. X23 TaxID=3045146 RepID=UPI0024ADE893|nr:pyridine nucleotide-disulfide oxidoreductase/dicluster-binding protein [Petroclostridium sp. X23]WHH60495.1 4Fe-4S dicluster domain-containing protein [Petroclostridium sp. X23]
MERNNISDFEEKCIQEHSPACTASCPVHVDVKKMNAQIKAGNFNEALKTFCASVPFPRIISRICDHPCESSCKRNEIDAGLNISLLEKTCLEYGEVPERRKGFYQKKDRKVAVIGSGLNGLTAALFLAEKGYMVSVIEKSDRVGHEIWDISDKILPKHLILDDFKIFNGMRVEFRYNTEIKDIAAFKEVCDQYDAVYISRGEKLIHPLGQEIEDAGNIMVGNGTFQTGHPKVFAGAGLQSAPNKISPITDISEGKRAAVSIDRFIQKVSLTASRGHEGAYITKMVTKITRIKNMPVVIPSNTDMGYVQEEAMREAGRCIQCSCLECVKACKYLEHYGKYPKKYIREISNNFNILVGKKTAKELINSCNMCGLCGEICPNALDMAEVNQIAKESAVKNGHMPPAIHDFPIRDMLFSNSSRFALKKHQPGFEKSKFVFYPGCQLSALEPLYVNQLYSDLINILQGGVGLLLGCCGAPAKWSGRSELFMHVMDRFYEDWLGFGKPEVLCACSTCKQMIKGSYPQIPVTSVWEVFGRYGLPGKSLHTDTVVSVHDPCTARYALEEHQAVRSILEQLGYSISELEFSKQKTKCCGYGGLTAYANPGLTEKVIQQRIQENSNDYVTYCINCRDYFTSKGKNAWHILDLIYHNTGKIVKHQKRVGYSQRQENRMKLKEKMLRERWREAMSLQCQDYESIKLHIPEEVMAMIDERLILIEDIQKTIYYAETTGNKVYNSNSNHFTAHYKPQIITYWVEYGIENEKYRIYNAYSHRLEIIEDVN